MRALARDLESPEMRGRHQGLGENREREILSWINKCATKSRPITRRDVHEHVTAEYDVSTTRKWANSFIARHISPLCVRTSSPQETQRLKVPRCFLDQTLACISQFVQSHATELIFHLNEVGISEWEDQKPKKVIAQKWMGEYMVHHRVNRNLKHVSVIAGVSAVGESLITYIITSQYSLRVREQFKNKGVRFGTNLILKGRRKPYINAECFLEYIRTVFPPNLNELRTLEEFADEEAVFLMDNCPSHIGEEIIRFLRDARVRIMTWAPYTTDIFQQLDIGLFGALKQKEQYALLFGNDQETIDFLLNIYRMFKQIMIEPNICGAFDDAGFEFDTRSGPYRLVFPEAKLRRTRAFQEIW
jgi:hypothetical protein